MSNPVRLRRKRDRDAPDGGGNDWPMGDLFAFDEITPSALAVGLAAALIGVLLFVVVWPLVALVLELVLVLIFFVAGVAGRVVLRRPWEIVAKTSGPPPDDVSWQVVGWRASGRAIDEIVGSLEAGEAKPRLQRSVDHNPPEHPAQTG